jgi:hypothetical protein
MQGLLQVAIYTSGGEHIASIEDMQNALAGSIYSLDVYETQVNNNIAMIITPTESEAVRLMEVGQSGELVALPSGYAMEIPVF